MRVSRIGKIDNIFETTIVEEIEPIVRRKKISPKRSKTDATEIAKPILNRSGNRNDLLKGAFIDEFV